MRQNGWMTLPKKLVPGKLTTILMQKTISFHYLASHLKYLNWSLDRNTSLDDKDQAKKLISVEKQTFQLEIHKNRCGNFLVLISCLMRRRTGFTLRIHNMRRRLWVLPFCQKLVLCGPLYQEISTPRKPGGSFPRICYRMFKILSQTKN